MSLTEILIVDDEPSICEMLYFSLGSEGFQVTQALNAEQALAQLQQRLPDLLLVDWMMPGMNGVDLVRCLRNNHSTRRIPIIMLSAKNEEPDKVKSLMTGADDYISKPFSRRELVARIKALLRRTRPDKVLEKIESGPLVLDPVEHHVKVNGGEIKISPTEFRLLHFLMAHPKQVFSRRRILDCVWGMDKVVEDRTVDVHVRRLRKTLAAHHLEQMVQTVRGAGYRFRPATGPLSPSLSGRGSG